MAKSPLAVATATNRAYLYRQREDRLEHQPFPSLPTVSSRVSVTAGPKVSPVGVSMSRPDGAVIGEHIRPGMSILMGHLD